MKYGMSSQVNYWCRVVVLGVALGFGLQVAQAWTNPAVAPPGGNVGGPLTTSNVAQTKPAQINITGGGAFGIGGLVVGKHSFNSHSDLSNNWLYLGDQANDVFSERGFAAQYLYANGAFTSANWSEFASGTNGYAAGFYNNLWEANSAAQSTAGSLYVNDIYLRSIDRWVSSVSGGGGASCGAGNITGLPYNYPAMSTGYGEYMEIRQVSIGNPNGENWYASGLTQCRNGTWYSVNITGAYLMSQSLGFCFTADTEVVLANGGTVMIEEVRIGDKLLGKDGSVNEVLGFLHHEKPESALYGFNGEKPFATEDHPFMTERGWKSINPEMTKRSSPDLSVGKLEIGDVIFTNEGKTKVVSIEIGSHKAGGMVYNFILGGNHSYYANGYLVSDYYQREK